MKKKCIFLSIIFLYGLNVLGQNAVVGKLSLVKTKNIELDSILDSVISHSQNCKLYSNKLFFKIDIFIRSDSTLLDISSASDPEVFFLDSTAKPFGLLIVGGADFVLFGDTASSIFEISKERVELNINKQNRIFVFEDPPEWLFLYKMCRFKLLKIENDCY